MVDIIPNWHPIFVHFTVALVPTATLFFILARFINNETLKIEFYGAAKWCLVLSAFFAVVTVITGFIAYFSVAHDAQSHIAMTIHRNWALITITAILITVLWYFSKIRKDRIISPTFMSLLVTTSILVSTTAWHGAELVYRYGLGVMSLPIASEHSHKHGLVDTHGHSEKNNTNHHLKTEDKKDHEHDHSEHDH